MLTTRSGLKDHCTAGQAPCTLQSLITDDKLMHFAVLPVSHIQRITAFVQHQAVRNVHFAPRQAIFCLKSAGCAESYNPGVAVPICYKDGPIVCHRNLQQGEQTRSAGLTSMRWASKDVLVLAVIIAGFVVRERAAQSKLMGHDVGPLLHMRGMRMLRQRPSVACEE